MKVTISCYLNERIGKASLSSKTGRVLSPGENIEITQVGYGDVIDGNGLWFGSATQAYYWSGGIYESDFDLGQSLNEFKQDEQIQILNYVKNLAQPLLKTAVSGYVGCGVGFKNLDTGNIPCLIVYVNEKIDLAVAKGQHMVLKNVLIKGLSIPTDVIALPANRLHYDPNTKPRDKEQDSPPRIGGGIRAISTAKTGTRSIVVKRLKPGSTNTYDYFLLASFHVLLSELIKDGSGRYSQGKLRARIPMNDDGEEFIITEGLYNQDADYAAIRLHSAGEVINNSDEVTITGYYEYDDFHKLKGRQVYMMGYKSGKQTAKILSMFNSITLDPYQSTFNNVVITEKLSIGGDSGAPVIDCETNKLIGFIIGGDELKVSFVLPFYNLRYDQKFYLNI
ncbi:hypothetical protein IM793_23025 [Pedobacter sp. MR2016-19]|uniref:hypothetical protein n=1 Tax=Pedobacter sp. MR2016-19 TaxID=2780089 RepID=UPI001876888B|nr:hypothetical protein [Pedobacter sp. MR2016-19]MBE5322047.1 hypothetical protein [Pedobacter sp. MR2016-19]